MTDPTDPEDWEETWGSPEEREEARRWPIALRELEALLSRIKDIRRANREELPAVLGGAERRRLAQALYEALDPEGHPECKRSVLRRMANKIGDYALWRREPTVPVVHELLALLPWWLSHLPGEAVARLRDLGLRHVMNGSVLPVQQVWADVLRSSRVFLGHCVCRSSGIADDLRRRPDAPPLSLVSSALGRRLLDRFLGRYAALVEEHGGLPDTTPRYADLCRRLRGLAEAGSPEYRLETLLEATYPEWEILPVLEGYTSAWIRSMHRNHKAHLLHRELVFELVTIHYLARGAVFTSMRLFDTPYTICTCPTPELGGGCVLTNWYYHGMSNESLLPNESLAHGRRRTEAGTPLPCRTFPVRSRRACLGCGCQHGAADPRDPEVLLLEADRIFAAYRDGASEDSRS